MHAALLTWTLAYRNSWSMIFHEANLLVLHTLALSAGRAADAVSVDAALAGRAAPRRARTLRLAAGADELHHHGGLPDRQGREGRRRIGLELGPRRRAAAPGRDRRLRKEVYGSHASPLAYRLYPHRRLFTAMAVVSLAVELGAPLALADHRLGRLWALSAFGMYWGILAVMGIKFCYQLSEVAFASWFDVERALALAARLWPVR